MNNVMEAYNKIMGAKTVAEAYDAQREAYQDLSEKDGDKLFDLLCDTDKRISPEIVHMGLNTDPSDKEWDAVCKKVCDIVERDGIAKASWSCTGRTRHMMHSHQLEEALPQYDFDISYESYRCVIKKRE